MGLLENAAEWLNSQREANLSIPVVHHSKNSRFEPTATLGRTLFRAENECGATIRVESRDFLISAARLPVEPRRGDMVFYAGHRYEALAPCCESVWRWSGANHITRRIYTKDTGGA